MANQIISDGQTRNPAVSYTDQLGRSDFTNPNLNYKVRVVLMRYIYMLKIFVNVLFVNI